VKHAKKAVLYIRILPAARRFMFPAGALGLDPEKNLLQPGRFVNRFMDMFSRIT